MDVSNRIRGERSGFHVRSVQNFVRLGRAEGVGSVSRGSFAACGRRVTFWTARKSPMAQATLSYPFGAIHLENR